MSDSPRWEPDRNAVHRLIQFLDVMAIAFQRFRQLSNRLPAQQPNEQFDSPAWMEGRTRLTADFNAIRNAISPPAEYPTGTRAQRLFDEAIAYFAHVGAKDDATRVAVANVADWLNPLFIAWNTPTPRPWNYYTAVVEADGVTRSGKRFEEEREWLNQYRPVRRALITALAGIGQTLPDHIDRRECLAFIPWRQDEPDPITQNELLALVAEAAPNSSPPTRPSTGTPDGSRRELREFVPPCTADRDQPAHTRTTTMAGISPPARPGIDPRLSADLAEALDAARSAALGAANLVGTARLDFITQEHFTPILEAIRKTWRRGPLIHAALADLVPVSSAEASFGASCAHSAALAMLDRVLGFGRDACKGELSLFRSLVQAGVLDDLPDAGAVVAACEREAYCANAARLARGSQPAPTPPEPARPSVEPAPVAPSTIDQADEMKKGDGEKRASDPEPALQHVRLDQMIALVNRSKGISLEVAEILVGDWLAKNEKDNPNAITRDGIAAAIGVAAGTVSNTAAWQAFKNRRDANKKPRLREVPLSDAMKAVIPADCRDPAQALELFKESVIEEYEENSRHAERRRKCRHDG